MRKKFFAFVASCLLLAAFTGYAGAQKIDTPLDSRLTIKPEIDLKFQGLPQDLADLERNLEGSKGGLKWLFALFSAEHVMDADASASQQENVSATDEEDFTFDEGLLFASQPADTSGDLLPEQPAATVASSDNVAASPSQPAGDQVPAVKQEEPVTPQNYYSLDPPIIVTVYPEAFSSKRKDRAPVVDPVIDPVIARKPPAKEPSRPKASDQRSLSGSSGSTGPVIVENSGSPASGTGTTEGKGRGKEPGTILAGKDPAPGGGPYGYPPLTIPPVNVSPPTGPVEFPIPDQAPELVDSSAPVPEPATMLLLFTGIAGLAMSRFRGMRE